jgi:hypothetical protein
MPRDSSGNYTLPTGNPVVSGTSISSTAHNTTMADVRSEITDSLCRSAGKGGMLAPLLFSSISATIKGAIADGASAVGVILDNVGALANAGAKALSVRVNGVEKFYLDKNGLHPILPVAWAKLACGLAGAVTVNEGHNVTSASWSGELLTVTLSVTMSSALFGVIAQNNRTSVPRILSAYAQSTTEVRVQQFDHAGVIADWANNDHVTVLVYGSLA